MADFVMLCEKAEPFNSKLHLFEPKLNGVRMVREQIRGRVRLYSRTGRDITDAFPELTKPSAHDHRIDGEAVVMGENGVPCFNYIQQRIGRQDALKIRYGMKQYPAQYWAFDLLSEWDWSGVAPSNFEMSPLIMRKKALEKWDKPANCHIVPYVVGEGVALFKKLTPQGWEGTVAKELSSHYQRRRTRAWVKSKAWQEDTFLIVGVTKGKGNRDGTIGSLLLATKDLQYVGDVGTGLTFADLAQLQKVLTPAEKSPLQNGKPEDLWYWTVPTVRAEVSYFEKTGDGKLFHPAVKRLLFNRK